MTRWRCEKCGHVIGDQPHATRVWHAGCPAPGRMSRCVECPDERDEGGDK